DDGDADGGGVRRQGVDAANTGVLRQGVEGEGGDVCWDCEVWEGPPGWREGGGGDGWRGEVERRGGKELAELVQERIGEGEEEGEG
ncbi:MAG: hypothetical protein Q9191_008437, partial [Dirinaria sp. TL-2023a]